ncbi:transposase [Blastococcus saxobsidens]|uniref:Transposase n=1 Tax=Blastococcus saxobsidens TaxID=138336 RepID=A0A6L9W551_9ACTN|nr:Mu transposase C-terminal domain-containing protein [Blastococcus saxobsidens]NEK86952.1 transposase [Blastococcus saxobsidens]
MTTIRPIPGVRLALAGVQHTVLGYDTAEGAVRLADENGVLVTLGVEDFVTHPDLHDPAGARAHNAAAERLSTTDRRLLEARIEHVREAETGYRSGDPHRPAPGEPRPQYNPETTTLTARRRTKAAELNNDLARAAGLDMSYTTIRRISAALNTGMGLDGVVDCRLVRRSHGRHSIDKRVEEACWIVFEETRQGSNVSMKTRMNKIKQWMLEHHGKGADALVPSASTIERWFKDRFIPSDLSGKARTRRSATTAPAHGFRRPNPTRPGELVLMDTNNLDVLLAGTNLAGVIRGSLVLGIDWYSRSVVEVRVVENAEKAIDITFALRDLARPMQMRAGWPDDARWPFVGVPEELITEIHGGEIAGLPFVNTEAVVVDHGSTYKSHISVAAARQQGISVLPARVRMGSDKAIVERFFGSLRSMLLEHLRGYRGSDSSERGANVDGTVVWSAQQLEDEIALWAVRIWQNHAMSEVKPPWCPEGDWSPNTLYQHGLSTSGLPPRVMSSDDYYGLLPTMAVKVHGRGVKIRQLWYDHEVLGPHRNLPSPYGGAAKGKWTVRYDPRDMRQVYFLDEDGQYQVIPWTGATGPMPCFTDRHVTALNRIRRESGMRPRHDSELVEILIQDVLTVHEPSSTWQTVPKKVLNDRSRTQRNWEMARRDREAVDLPADDDHPVEAEGQEEAATDAELSRPGSGLSSKPPATVTAIGTAAVADARARKRQNATVGTVVPAARLGAKRGSTYGDLAALTDEEPT